MAENTLIDFSRTMAVLEELAKDIREGYVAMIDDHGHTASGKLAESMQTIRVEVEDGGRAFEIVANLEDYWKYLEHGTAPHWPPIDAIRKWIEVKPVIPRPGPDGRIPTPAQLALLISRKISEDGTPATNLLAKTKEGIIPYYIPKIRQALAEDAAGYIRMTWGTVNGTRVSW